MALRRPPTPLAAPAGLARLAWALATTAAPFVAHAAPPATPANDAPAAAEVAPGAAGVPAQVTFVADVNQPRVERPTRVGATELTWLGHAAWLLRSPKGTTVLVDPWLTNPRAPSDFVLPSHIDAILVTHGHADHLGEAAALSRRFGAPVVGSYELIEQLGLEHGIGANPGGTVQVGDLKVHLTAAVHSSSLALPQASQASSALPSPEPQGADCGCHGAGTPAQAEAAEASQDGAGGSLLARTLRADQLGAKGVASGRAHPAAPPASPMRPRPAGAHEAPLAHGELPAGAAPTAAGKGCAHGCSEGCAHACAQSGGRPCAHDGAHKAARGGAQPCAEGCTHACHGGPSAPADGAPRAPRFAYAGAALGFVVEVENGPSIYHAGDTDVFADMRLIARRYRPEVAILPIGDHFTMGPRDAALAARLLGAKEVVPMHYGTFPQLTGTPAALREAIGGDARVTAPRPGGRLTFVGHGDG